MYNKYAEKCDVCGKWSHDYQNYHNQILVCKECFEKNHGQFQLDEPEQLNLFEPKIIKVTGNVEG